VKNLKKKLILLVVVLVAAVIIVSGCSEDALKDRVPGVKANVSMLLADNDEGDLEYEVGEVKTEEDFTDENEDSFGIQIIGDVEEEIKETSKSKIIINEEGNDDFPELPVDSKTVDGNTTISIPTDQAQNLESINFSAGELIIDVSTLNTTSELLYLTIDGKTASIKDNQARFDLNNGPDLTKSSLDIFYEIEIDDITNFTEIKFDLSFSTDDVEINNIKVNLSNFDWNNSDYDLSMDEVLIEDYEREEFIDYLTVSDSEMYINFDIAEGINLDLSKVDVKPNFESNQDYNFSLAEEDLTLDSSRAYLDLAKIVSMLQNDKTTDIKIAGEIGLTSDEVITITKESELGVKNAVLESAELNIDNYQMDPEAAEEGLTSKEVEDIKKGLDNVEVTVEGINNPLPAAVDLKFYVKDGASTKDELFKGKNKVTTFNLKANTVNGKEVIVIDKDQFDKFIGNDLYVGLELYSYVTFTKEEYNEKKVTIEKVKTKFNVDLKVDDLDE
jgi:hypothetical protein